jgi:hypothetical protein
MMCTNIPKTHEWTLPISQKSSPPAPPKELEPRTDVGYTRQESQKKEAEKGEEMSVFQKIRQPQLTKLLCVNQKKIYL